MYIEIETCTNCAKCIQTCPVEAIYVDRKKKRVMINQDLCVECGACYRANICESGGLVRPNLSWPRSVRAALSDPITLNPETGVAGRGTEEMKTNEVTGRFKQGQIGIAIELGRPGIGSSFIDIQKVTRACAMLRVQFCSENPITYLMTNTTTGDINPEILGERVLSAIVEFQVALEDAPNVLRTIKDVSEDLDTVFSFDAISLGNPDGCNPMFSLLEELGFHPSPNGKNNMGLGRPNNNYYGEINR